MYSVVVLISTYNGEKYLKEQLESILAQKNVNISILARDDGSTDSTKNILESYSKNEKLRWYCESNVGPAHSFLDLINKAEKADFYAFSDQDDIWDEDKLYSAVEMLKHETGAAMYHSRKRLVDADGTYIGISGSYNSSFGLCSLAARNAATGCTCVFNYQLLNELRNVKPQKVIMHDAWLLDVCLAINGKVLFDETPHISYRQHGNNAVGAKKDLKSFIQRLRYSTKKNSGLYLEQWKSLKNGYYNKMKDEDKEVLDICITYKESCKNKMRLLSNKRIMNGSFLKKILVVYKVVFEKY